MARTDADSRCTAGESPEPGPEYANVTSIRCLDATNRGSRWRVAPATLAAALLLLVSVACEDLQALGDEMSSTEPPGAPNSSVNDPATVSGPACWHEGQAFTYVIDLDLNRFEVSPIRDESHIMNPNITPCGVDRSLTPPEISIWGLEKRFAGYFTPAGSLLLVRGTSGQQYWLLQGTSWAGGGSATTVVNALPTHVAPQGNTESGNCQYGGETFTHVLDQSGDPHPVMGFDPPGKIPSQDNEFKCVVPKSVPLSETHTPDGHMITPSPDYNPHYWLLIGTEWVGQ